MKSSNKKVTRIFCVLLSLTMLALSGLLASAAPANTIGDLNNKRTDIKSKIEDTDAKIQELTPEVRDLTIKLTAAKLVEKEQFDSMKSRIRYMYEEGSYSLIESLLGASSMSEFLVKSEYVQSITQYDRKMLDEFTATRKQIEDSERELQSKQDELVALQNTLNEQLSETEESIKAELANQLKLSQEAAAAALNNMPSDEMVLFAGILQAEAGSSDYNALLAVATVILNRVANSGQSISQVVYAPGQFSPTWNGSLNRVLSSGPAPLCVQVANDAINGARTPELVGWCTQFRMAGHRDGIIIGDNVFF